MHACIRFKRLQSFRLVLLSLIVNNLTHRSTGSRGLDRDTCNPLCGSQSQCNGAMQKVACASGD